MNEWIDINESLTGIKKIMKEFSCCNGHQFDGSECKEIGQERPVCPFCWPFGFMNHIPKKEEKSDTLVKYAEQKYLNE